MSTDLVKIETNNLPSTGMENIKLTPTLVKLVQPTTSDAPEGVVPGQYLDTLEGVGLKTFGAIILSISPGRNYFEDPQNLVGGPTCKSFNGIVPDPSSPVIQSESCATCPRSKWGPKVNGKAKKPECGESYRVLYLEEETFLPKIIYIRGLGIQPFKTMLKLVQAKIQMSKRKDKKVDLYNFRMTFSTKKNGPVYEPVFSDVREHGQDISNELQDYVYAFRAAQTEEVVEQGINNELDVTFEQV